jgi:hypothetical protein
MRPPAIERGRQREREYSERGTQERERESTVREGSKKGEGNVHSKENRASSRGSLIFYQCVSI